MSTRTQQRRQQESRKPGDGYSQCLRIGWSLHDDGLVQVSAGFYVIVEVYRLGLELPTGACDRTWSLLQNNRLYTYNHDDVIATVFDDVVALQKQQLGASDGVSEPAVASGGASEPAVASGGRYVPATCWNEAVTSLRRKWIVQVAYIIYLGGEALLRKHKMFDACTWPELAAEAMKIWHDKGTILSAYGGTIKNVLVNKLKKCSAAAAQAIVWEQIERIKFIQTRASQILHALDERHSIDDVHKYLSRLQRTGMHEYGWKIYCHFLLQTPACRIPQKDGGARQCCVDAQTWVWLGDHPARLMSSSYEALRDKDHESHQQDFVDVYRSEFLPAFRSALPSRIAGLRTRYVTDADGVVVLCNLAHLSAAVRQ